MNRIQAHALAGALSDAFGLAWQVHHTGGNLWIVRRTRSDGSVVVFGEGYVLEYASQDAYDNGSEAGCIAFEFAV